jgi:hypothetical protein
MAAGVAGQRTLPSGLESAGGDARRARRALRPPSGRRYRRSRVRRRVPRTRRPAKGSIMRGHVARSLLLAAGVSASAPLLGCYVEVRSAVVVDAPPPPPRRVEVDARPGHVWVDGSWVSRGGRWVWRDGHWLRARPGHIYVQGRWVRRGGRWHWVEPRWEARAHSRARGFVDAGDALRDVGRGGHVRPRSLHRRRGERDGREDGSRPVRRD